MPPIPEGTFLLHARNVDDKDPVRRDRVDRQMV
jgi:hypothetical protein